MIAGLKPGGGPTAAGQGDGVAVACAVIAEDDVRAAGGDSGGGIGGAGYLGNLQGGAGGGFGARVGLFLSVIRFSLG